MSHNIAHKIKEARRLGLDKNPNMHITRQQRKVPLSELRVWDSLIAALPGSASNDDLGLITGTFLSAAPTVQSGDGKATTITRRAAFLCSLGKDYLAGQNVTVRLNVGMLTTISDGTATVDVEAVRLAAPTVDLCATAAQSINALTAADKDFVLTGTNLTPDDVLLIRVTMAITDAATGTAVIGKINDIELLMPERY